jgi:hypothetical protein
LRRKIQKNGLSKIHEQSQKIYTEEIIEISETERKLCDPRKSSNKLIFYESFLALRRSSICHSIF